MTAFTALAAGTPLACLAQAMPPPGLYQLDQTSTFRWTTPMGVMEKVEQVDGATGRVTVTDKSPSAPRPVVTVLPGDGPRRECQGPTASVVVGNCRAETQSGVDTVTASFTCDGRAQRVVWRKIGPTEWEKTLKSSPVPGGSPAGGLPPQVAQAMAPVIEKMEAAARTASPQEAAVLRQQIAAIQRGGGSATSNEPEVENLQRWTLISHQCKPAESPGSGGKP
ncbi:hypothetical protein AACH06_29455 [Ideonella sp. DXS29W]|uniref:DUF922 domain-containing protein n=1 Tax=Ideonella lacteola TaxID=2984193 RepID=A0ABU9BY97_9BURK